MKNLTDLESDVGMVARHEGVVITTGVNLGALNRIYRSLCLALPWPELRRLDTSLATTTTAGVVDATYNWPKKPLFNNVLRLQIQDGDDLNRYKDIPTPVDELVWEQMEGKKPQGVPSLHQLFSNSDEVTKVEFRPAPKFTGKTLRITGIIEPDKLVNQEDQTVFRFASADDALVYMVAADLLDVDGFPEFADKQMNKAGQLLGQIFGRDIAPVELPTRIIRG